MQTLIIIIVVIIVIIIMSQHDFEKTAENAEKETSEETNKWYVWKSLGRPFTIWKNNKHHVNSAKW